MNLRFQRQSKTSICWFLLAKMYSSDLPLKFQFFTGFYDMHNHVFHRHCILYVFTIFLIFFVLFLSIMTDFFIFTFVLLFIMICFPVYFFNKNFIEKYNNIAQKEAAVTYTDYLTYSLPYNCRIIL